MRKSSSCKEQLRSLPVKGVAGEYGSKVRNFGVTLKRSGNGRGKPGRKNSERDGRRLRFEDPLRNLSFRIKDAEIDVSGVVCPGRLAGASLAGVCVMAAPPAVRLPSGSRHLASGVCRSL